MRSPEQLILTNRIEYVAKLEKQNTALVEALKKIAHPPPVFETDNAIDVISWAIEIAKKALAQAGGE